MPAKMVVTYRKQNRKLENTRRHRRNHFYSQGMQGRIAHLLSCKECFDWRRDRVEDEVDERLPF
jgi:hypothetical protein